MRRVVFKKKRLKQQPGRRKQLRHLLFNIADLFHFITFPQISLQQGGVSAPGPAAALRWRPAQRSRRRGQRITDFISSLFQSRKKKYLLLCCCPFITQGFRKWGQFKEISKYLAVSFHFGSFSAIYNLLNFNSSCLLLFREADRNYFKVKWFNSDDCNATVQYYNI